MPAIERLRVYLIKGLDGVDVDSTAIVDGGTLAHDREFALYDDSGVVNGKRTSRVHDLQTAFDPETETFTAETNDGERVQFDLSVESERTRAESWFGDFFGMDLTLERDQQLGFVDRREMGPSVITTGTVETVASWFDEMTPEGARRRLRANIEVSGVPPFWEDRFVGDGAPAFEAGGVRFEGVTPCGRCVVPERDPDTGTPIEEFRERFIEKRKETFPSWADPAAFDHYFTVMLIATIPERDRGEQLETGDPVAVLESTTE